MSRPSGAPPLLTTDQLGFTLPDGRALFAGLTLGFGRERTGLVGANGVGKSTLVRLLVGELRPSSGGVTRRGRIAYLSQRRDARAAAGAVPDDASRTVAAALGVADALAALDRVLGGGADPADFDRVGADWDLRERVEAELARFGLEHLAPERPVATLSGGEATRVALAGLVLGRPEMLVLDEPTNDLDAPSRDALYRFVEGWAGGMLVITHDRALLSRVDRIVELSTLGARSYGGNYDVYEAQRAAEEGAAAHDLAHARKELRKTERAAQAMRERQARRDGRGKRERATANAPKIWLNMQRERSQATSGRVGELAERLVGERRGRVAAARARVEVRERLALDLPPSGLPAGKVVVAAAGLRYAHPGAAAPVLGGLDLLIVGPERVALTGPNGSGKTTLLRLLAGELPPGAGAVRLGVAADAVAYLDQHAARLRPERSVLDNFRAANPSLDATATRHALARYLFRADAALARVDTLSGGERLRAALACTVNALRPAQLLLLDEPTNHLDLDSLRAVEDVLASYDGALVVVSHDETFLDAIGVERRVELRGR
ncbi:MAG TPA: ABC-F family ATP-binding cassette domain-containing protein [Gemmatimonadaceae bacterium]|nr:ABC-F family ATP-binding cassette domain-containing protein [Gemmatimonadaceae bacterium]